MAAECVVLVVVRTVVVVCVVVCEQHLVCELGGQVSEARVVRTFLANDAAYLTLLGAVTQLRRSEIVSLGVGLPVVVLCGVFNESWVSADCPFLRIKTQHITLNLDSFWALPPDFSAAPLSQSRLPLAVDRQGKIRSRGQPAQNRFVLPG